ncbi:ribonuclease III [Sphingosinicella sp. LHD-64]|uniref:ribonuclease III n=1 Tax=Sphingosinicella sp. LHD-64 TaxID=3072139 RepID=UPI00280F7C84|nr:ribonuclease III [Sphingosinicella sp. LHD-64]MDQ8755170.1 ribonuclease III [Sphingosinicella sp. LHD-64]
MSNLADWIEGATGHRPNDLALFERALTHASFGEANYERLEFLGDRVLGMIVALWLYETYPDEPEGKLSHRLNALVTREVCAEIARALDAQPHIRLGKQAIDDGVFRSDNVLGDVVEALIGALYLDAGFEAARAFVHRAWADRVDRLAAPPKHPKAALQEWSAANKRRPPDYRIVETSGPDHARRFTVEVSVSGVGAATGQGLSKQEAETEAAKALLASLA